MRYPTFYTKSFYGEIKIISCRKCWIGQSNSNVNLVNRINTMSEKITPSVSFHIQESLGYNNELSIQKKAISKRKRGLEEKIESMGADAKLARDLAKVCHSYMKL